MEEYMLAMLERSGINNRMMYRVLSKIERKNVFSFSSKFEKLSKSWLKIMCRNGETVISDQVILVTNLSFHFRDPPPHMAPEQYDFPMDISCVKRPPLLKEMDP